MVEFTDSTLTICWPRNIAKKAAKYWKKPFYICKYKTPSNINNVYVSQHFQNVKICIIYGLEKELKVAIDC